MKKLNEKLKEAIVTSLDNQKGNDILAIDLTNKTELADYIVIASGTSNRHVYTLASKLVDDLKKAGYKNITMEGEDNANWIIVDTQDILVHLFQPAVREYYQLEKLWLEEI